MPRKTSRPVHISTTLTREAAAKLERRAALQGLSMAEVLRILVDALPEPLPARRGDGGEEE